MHRPFKIALVAVFVGLLWLVGLQVLWPFIPDGPALKGVVLEPQPVRWDRQALWQGTTFRTIDKWYDGHVGLRNFWVRLDNQLTFSLFYEVPQHATETPVIVSEHEWLFEPQYIRNAIRPRDISDTRLREYAQQIRTIQDKLARYGVPFYLIVAPNKAEVYPEHVPPAYFARHQPAEITTNYKRARTFFREAGIHFYDGPGRFAEWKNTGDRYLFARAGTHWSYDAAFRVLQEIREQLNPLLRHPMPELKLGGSPMKLPQANDHDLLDPLNLLYTGMHEHKLPSPLVIPQHTVPEAQLPRILWVHDSFGWNLIELLYSANAAQPSESLYYFGVVHGSENVFRIPGAIKTDLPVNKIEWKSYLKSYDAVIMVWTDIAFDHYGWGFFQAIDRALP